MDLLQDQQEEVDQREGGACADLTPDGERPGASVDMPRGGLMLGCLGAEVLEQRGEEAGTAADRWSFKLTMHISAFFNDTNLWLSG